MSRYTATDDPLCYPGSHVLRNIAELTDQDELDQFEQLMFLTRAEEEMPKGDLDYQHYREIHHHFFQDVYDWAGQIRQIRTGKGGNWFCYPEYIDEQMEVLFGQLADEDHLVQVDDVATFSDRAAHYIAEINAVHPFREGNGRCQLILLTVLADLVGFQLTEDQLDETSFMEAMIKSFHGNNASLSAEIRIMVSGTESD